MEKLNYFKLMELKPTVYQKRANKLGQIIEYVEHPLKGDNSPVIAICHSLRLAVCTDFFDCDDFYDGSDYEVCFVGNKAVCAFELM